MNFETQQELIAGVREQLKLMPKAAFLGCFQKLIHRAEKCVAIGGHYVEKVWKELKNKRKCF